MQLEGKDLNDAAGGAAQVRNVCVGGQHVVGEVGVVVKVVCALVAKLVLGLVSRGVQVRASLAQVHGHGAWEGCLVFGVRKFCAVYMLKLTEIDFLVLFRVF